MKFTFSGVVSVLALMFAAPAFFVSVYPGSGPDADTARALVTGDEMRPEIEGDRLLRWMVSQEEADILLREHLQRRYVWLTNRVIAKMNANIAKAVPEYEPLNCPPECTGEDPPSGGCKIRPDCD